MSWICTNITSAGQKHGRVMFTLELRTPFQIRERVIIIFLKDLLELEHHV